MMMIANNSLSDPKNISNEFSLVETFVRKGSFCNIIVSMEVSGLEMTNPEYFSCASDDSSGQFSVTFNDTWLDYDATSGVNKLSGKERSHANARERYRTHR